MDNMPKVLYHYTTVSALASILESKKIRFSPLTKLDDLQEERVKDNQKFGKFVFVSSWTEDAEESIPMWTMYSSLESGIRIKLLTLPFREYIIKDEKLNKSTNTIIPKEMFDSSFNVIGPHFKENLIHQIEYTDNISILEPQLKYQKDGKTFIELGKLGKHKRKSWSFQKEWRYILQIYPAQYNDINKNRENAIFKMEKEFDNALFAFPFNYYYLEIDKEAFSNMEIIMSPNISNGNRIIVKLLKEKYNPKMKVDESILKGNIR